MNDNWLVMPGSNDDRHVIPNFGRPHDLTAECWCRPKKDDEDQTVIVHWSHEPIATLRKRNDHD